MQGSTVRSVSVGHGYPLLDDDPTLLPLRPQDDVLLRIRIKLKGYEMHLYAISKPEYLQKESIFNQTHHLTLSCICVLNQRQGSLIALHYAKPILIPPRASSPTPSAFVHSTASVTLTPGFSPDVAVYLANSPSTLSTSTLYA